MKDNIVETVKMVQSGDKDAFAALYEQYAKTIYFQVSNIVHNKQDIDDIVAGIFLTAFEKIGDLKSPEAFSSWLGKIAISKSTDYLRAQQKAFEAEAETASGSPSETADVEDFEELDPGLIPDKALDNAETARIIYEIIQDLPLPQRACIHFYYYEQLSIKEIAENLAVSENTVKTRLSLARKKIREELERREEKDGLKLWMASPLAIVPILKFAFQNTQVPANLAGEIVSNLGIEIPLASAATAEATAATTAGTTSAASGTAAAGGATVTSTTVATTGATTAMGATSSVLGVKAIAGIVAGVVVTGSVIAGVVLLGGEDEEIPETTPPVVIESTPTPTPTPEPIEIQAVTVQNEQVNSVPDVYSDFLPYDYMFDLMLYTGEWDDGMPNGEGTLRAIGRRADIDDFETNSFCEFTLNSDDWVGGQLNGNVTIELYYEYSYIHRWTTSGTTTIDGVTIRGGSANAREVTDRVRFTIEGIFVNGQVQGELNITNAELENFSYKDITDAQLIDMIENGEIPVSVTVLDLAGNQITDISILSELAQLSFLNLEGNQISEEQISQLQETLPHCNIDY